MSELRQKMLTDLRIRNYAERTQEIYITRVAEMARHFGRSLADLSAEEVREYLRYLTEERKVSRSGFAQTVGGLRFLYRFTLDRSEMVPHIPYPRLKRRQPQIYTHVATERLRGTRSPLDALSGVLAPSSMADRYAGTQIPDAAGSVGRSPRPRAEVARPPTRCSQALHSTRPTDSWSLAVAPSPHGCRSVWS